MKKIFLLLVLPLVLLVASCKKEVDNTGETKPIELPASSTSVINASNQFAFDFLKATLQNDTSSNTLISPLSIYMALSMVYNGADNSTKDSIANTLRLSGIDISSLNEVCKALIEQMPVADNKVKMSIANSIWYKNSGMQPLSSFLNTIQADYHGEIKPLDFSDPNSLKTINDWVAQNTNNKIPTILNEINPDDLMYLINAIYFNGAWQYEFKTADTHNASFTLQNGAIISTPFMNQTIKTVIHTDNSMALLELPYGSGKSYSMYLALPANNQQPVKEFAALMNDELLKNAIADMDSVSIEVSLPSWEYAYSIDDMKPELRALGMNIAFTDKADFSKIYRGSSITISKAIHKTYIKVNEEGTEAAAVTAIGIAGTSAQLPPAIKFDRPFLYAIVEKQTGAVLFVGTVGNPALH